VTFISINIKNQIDYWNVYRAQRAYGIPYKIELITTAMCLRFAEVKFPRYNSFQSATLVAGFPGQLDMVERAPLRVTSLLIQIHFLEETSSSKRRSSTIPGAIRVV
jgi:hypothetical protein